MIEAEYHKPSEVAELFGISPATLRRWSDLFSHALSADAAPKESGTRRRYTEDDLFVLARAAALIDHGLSLEEVSEHLKTISAEELRAQELPRKPPEPPEEPESTTGQDMPPDAGMALVPLMRALDMITGQQRLIADQAERMSRQEAEIAGARERLAEQAQRIADQAERLEELEKRLGIIESKPPERPASWLDRLLGR